VAGDILPRLAKQGVIVAGGLHKDNKGNIFSGCFFATLPTFWLFPFRQVFPHWVSARSPSYFFMREGLTLLEK
jgi:hypothetical protein